MKRRTVSLAGTKRWIPISRLINHGERDMTDWYNLSINHLVICLDHRLEIPVVRVHLDMLSAMVIFSLGKASNAARFESQFFDVWKSGFKGERPTWQSFFYSSSCYVFFCLVCGLEEPPGPPTKATLSLMWTWYKYIHIGQPLTSNLNNILENQHAVCLYWWIISL